MSISNSNTFMAERLGYIYALRCNGAIRYVGQTVMSLAQTISRHRQRSRAGFRLHVYNWMRRVGVENVTIVAIERIASSQLNVRERYWIGVFRNLTNILPGGQRWGSRRCPDGCDCKKHHSNKRVAVCSQCEREFKYRASDQRGKYCSWRCFRDSVRRSLAKCAVCHRIYDRPGNGRKLVCSKACWKTLQSRGGQRLSNKCKPGCECGRHSKPPMSETQKARLSKIKTLPPLFGVCDWCGQQFQLQRKHNKVSHCSRECALKHWHRNKGHKETVKHETGG